MIPAKTGRTAVSKTRQILSLTELLRKRDTVINCGMFSRVFSRVTRALPALPALTLACTLAACDAGRSSEPKKPACCNTSDEWKRPTTQTPLEAHGKLSVSGSRLTDEKGQPVQLKGVSSMWLNWENDGYAESLDALTWMRDNWNISLIRAAMGISPGGAYLTNPDKAKTQVTTIVDNAIAAGVYVIVDWHSHEALNEQAKAVEFFTEMAQKYVGVPNVIFETFNEPLGVDWSTQLKPYHEAIVSAVRAIDPDRILILGTPHWSQDVDIAALDPVQGGNLMYTLHFYSCTHGGVLNKGANAVARGLPLFVTEWGATNADGGLDGKVCEDEAATWLEFLEDEGIGWAAWKLDGCEPDSTCLLVPGTPVNGGWTSEYLHGHAPFVRDWLRR
ncbi:MAG TPA: glycoside hydrolase family 5 protein [Polyangiaceae bacterium]|nr:glycoside hydrolase family 5 protein [Polyangiaceae bacterium]